MYIEAPFNEGTVKRQAKPRTSSVVNVLKRFGLYVWTGPVGLPRSVQLEWRFVAIRWLGIALVGPALLLADLPPKTALAAYAVLLSAMAYNLIVQVLLQRHPQVFASGFLTTASDAVLNVAMIMAAGGFDSPFYFILYPVTISAAMRYGYGPAIAVVGIYVSFDTVEGIWRVQALDAPFIFRSGFLLITAVLASYLREQATSAEKALQTRLYEEQNLNAELEAFSYSVSHDLRAPLRSIEGFSRALQEDYDDRLDDVGRDYTDRLCKASQRMAALIDDLLELSRVSRQDLVAERVNLTTIVESLTEELRERDPDRNANVVVRQGMWANGDAQLIRLVFQNLLGNAWKFTSRKERAEIEAGMRFNQGETVYFVKDNGAGFDEQYVDKLFGAFRRLHSANEFEGTGIGLATVQRIVRRHGGQVWAHGAVDEGATFSFTLGRSGAEVKENSGR